MKNPFKIAPFNIGSTIHTLYNVCMYRWGWGWGKKVDVVKWSKCANKKGSNDTNQFDFLKKKIEKNYLLRFCRHFIG